MRMIAGLLMLQSLTANPVPPREDDIVVTGRRPRDELADTVEDTIVARSIKALAADSIAELLAKLRSRYGEDLPIVVDGRRLGATDAAAELPPEALTRIEILKPGTGGRFGYSGTSRVLNLVLRPKFDSVTLEGAASTTTEGGADTEIAASRYARVRNGHRLNGSIQYRRTGPLLQSQRGTIDPSLVGETPEDRISAGYRSLVPNAQDVAVTTGLTIPVRSISLDVALSAGAADTRSLTGLYRFGPTDDDPAVTIVRKGSSRYLRASAGFSGTLNRLFWSITANGDLARATSILVRRDVDERGMGDGSMPVAVVLPVAPKLQSTTAETSDLSLKALANAIVGHLPAGDIRFGGNVSALRTRLASRSTDSRESGPISSYRTSIQVNVETPLINRDVTALAWLGSINLNVEVEYISVSGQAGAASGQAILNWSLSPEVSFAISRSYQETPPSIGSLFSVPVTVPGSLVYDDRAGMFVPVLLITGGNPAIRQQSQSEQRFRLSLGNGGSGLRMAGSITYAISKIDNPLLSFSNPTALVEASVPTLFVRDHSGRLIQYDARSFSGKARTSSRLIADLHLFGSFLGKAVERPAETDRRSAATWDLNVAYEFAVKDRITLDEGQLSLDILTNPLSLASTTLARHRLNLNAALAGDIYGVNFGGSWQSGFRGVAIDDTQSPVSFSSLMVLNIEGFIEPGRAKEDDNAGKIRIKLAVDNVLNRRIRSMDLRPSSIRSFSGSLLDPLGRVLRLSIRKVF